MSATAVAGKRRVGVVGFGALGQYLVTKLLTEPAALAQFELVFIWNRTAAKITEFQLPASSTPSSSAAASTDDSPHGPAWIDPKLVLEDLADFPSRSADLIIEVAHPAIYATFGAKFLAHADLFVGSPTVFADPTIAEPMYAAAGRGGGSPTTTTHGNGLYVPAGALWGASDILKMGDRGTITAAHITMRKPPDSFRLEEPLNSVLQEYIAEIKKGGDGDSQAQVPASKVLFDGPVSELCPMAPNNTNTMACLAIATGRCLDFKSVRGTLIADRDSEAHIIEVEVTGKPLAARKDPFVVKSTRYNPCDPNSVTASATYASFYSSLLNTAMKRGPSVHFC